MRSGVHRENRSSVWLALPVIATKAEQTKERTSSKQNIAKWLYRNDCNLQHGAIKEGKEKF